MFYSFSKISSLELRQTCSLAIENLLLSGTVLKNTPEAYGVCVYSGTETKLSLNSKITRIKFSTVEKSLNGFILFYLAIMLGEMALSTVLSLAIGVEYYNKGNLEQQDFHTYLFSFLEQLQHQTVSLA